MTTFSQAYMKAAADRMVAAYNDAKTEYVIGRRDSALLMAQREGMSTDQVFYWRSIAAGCSKILEGRRV